MMKPFTLPPILETGTGSLADQEPFELLYRSQLVDYLNEQFEEVSLTPDERVVKNILEYSKAVEVQNSQTMVDDHVYLLN